jgi:gamma-glutamylcyclotransferase (GGCT)/AIG2-like uncharacterized protein YtfP
MSGKCLLFVYGMLRTDCTPPRSVSESWDDAIKGDLYDLGTYPALKNIGKSKNWCEGQILEIDSVELPALDDFEDVESGEYERVITESRDGRTVWAYQYLPEIIDTENTIEKWVRASNAPKFM